MACKACGSERQGEFNGEVAIHFPGLQGLDKPMVWVFPQLVVCLNCGVAQFAIPKAELSVLAGDLPLVLQDEQIASSRRDSQR